MQALLSESINDIDVESLFPNQKFFWGDMNNVQESGMNMNPQNSAPTQLLNYQNNSCGSQQNHPNPLLGQLGLNQHMSQYRQTTVRSSNRVQNCSLAHTSPLGNPPTVCHSNIQTTEVVHGNFVTVVSTRESISISNGNSFHPNQSASQIMNHEAEPNSIPNRNIFFSSQFTFQNIDHGAEPISVPNGNNSLLNQSTFENMNHGLGPISVSNRNFFLPNQSAFQTMTDGAKPLSILNHNSFLPNQSTFQNINREPEPLSTPNHNISFPNKSTFQNMNHESEPLSNANCNTLVPNQSNFQNMNCETKPNSIPNRNIFLPNPSTFRNINWNASPIGMLFPETYGQLSSDVQLDKSDDKDSAQSEINQVKTPTTLDDQTLSTTAAKSQPRKKYGPYTCPQCGEVSVTCQHYASHMMSHYRSETMAERKRRHAAKFKGKNLRLVETNDGLTAVPKSLMKERNSIGKIVRGLRGSTPKVVVKTEGVEKKGGDDVAAINRKIPLGGVVIKEEA